MAILYSYPIAQPAITDLLLGTHVDPDRPYDGNPTKSFYMADIINLAGTTTVSNATATPLSLATLNTLYPNAMIGFKVQCANPAVLKIYEKTSTTAWVSYTIAIVV
jgi:Tfp pilus assembly protein PilV